MTKYIKVLACISVVLLVSFVFTRCTKDNKETLYKDQVCDTTNVTYSGTIQPIIATNCLHCHGNNVYMTNANGVQLEGYSNIYPKAQSRLILHVLNHDPGYPPMPHDRTDKLPACTIAKITAWVNAGAPNN